MSRINFQELPFVLQVGETKSVFMTGRTLRVIESDFPFRLGFDDGPDVLMEAGLSFDGIDEFRKVTLTNPGAAVVTGRLTITDGTVGDSRSVFSTAVPIPVNPQIYAAPPEQTEADHAIAVSASAVVIAPNANRKWFTITNTGGTPVTVGSYLLNPGESYHRVADVAANLSAVNPSPTVAARVTTYEAT